MANRPSFWSIWLRELRLGLGEIDGGFRLFGTRLYVWWTGLAVLFVLAALFAFIHSNVTEPKRRATLICGHAVVAFEEYTMQKPVTATEDIIDRALIDMIDLCEPYLLQR
jgi:hypothetical protein